MQSSVGTHHVLSARGRGFWHQGHTISLHSEFNHLSSEKRKKGDSFAHPLIKALAQAKYGCLALEMPDGHLYHINHNQPGPNAHLKLNNWHVLDRILAQGNIGFHGSYIEHEWESRDPLTLLDWILTNEEQLRYYFHGHPIYAFFHHIKEYIHQNLTSPKLLDVIDRAHIVDWLSSLWFGMTIRYAHAYPLPHLHKHVELPVQEVRKTLPRSNVTQLYRKPKIGSEVENSTRNSLQYVAPTQEIRVSPSRVSSSTIYPVRIEDLPKSRRDIQTQSVIPIYERARAQPLAYEKGSIQAQIPVISSAIMVPEAPIFETMRVGGIPNIAVLQTTGSGQIPFFAPSSLIYPTYPIYPFKTEVFQKNKEDGQGWYNLQIREQDSIKPFLEARFAQAPFLPIPQEAKTIEVPVLESTKSPIPRLLQEERLSLQRKLDRDPNFAADQITPGPSRAESVEIPESRPVVQLKREETIAPSRTQVRKMETVEREQRMQEQQRIATEDLQRPQMREELFTTRYREPGRRILEEAATRPVPDLKAGREMMGLEQEYYAPVVEIADTNYELHHYQQDAPGIEVAKEQNMDEQTLRQSQNVDFEPVKDVATRNLHVPSEEVHDDISTPNQSPSFEVAREKGSTSGRPDQILAMMGVNDNLPKKAVTDLSHQGIKAKNKYRPDHKKINASSKHVLYARQEMASIHIARSRAKRAFTQTSPNISYTSVEASQVMVNDYQKKYATSLYRASEVTVNGEQLSFIAAAGFHYESANTRIWAANLNRNLLQRTGDQIVVNREEKLILEDNTQKCSVPLKTAKAVLREKFQFSLALDHVFNITSRIRHAHRQLRRKFMYVVKHKLNKPKPAGAKLEPTAFIL